MLNRRPEGVALAEAVGLPVEHPTVASSRIWTRGGLRPLPRSLMGVPLDLDALAASGVLSEAGLARVRTEPSLPPTPVEGDVSVGDLVAARFGDEVVDRLVEPLLGGVYAGHARRLSARASVPQLVALAERGSLLEQAAAIPTTYDLPVFAGIPGGMGRLPEALAAGLDLRTDATVRELVRTPDGFALTIGPTIAPERVQASAVLLATPAAPTARLLGEVAPVAAAELARDRVRLDGGGDLRLPGRGRRRPGGVGLLGLPGAAGRRAADQGLDVLLRQVGLGAGGRCRAGRGAPADLAGPARRGDGAPGHRRRAGRLVARRPGGGHRLPARPRSTCTCSAGAADCRSTRWVTWTGWPGCVPRCRRVSRWRVRRTTGSGIPAVIASARLAVERLLADR